MGLSFEEVKRIKEEFETEYWFGKPFSEYMNMCGISCVGICDSNALVSERKDFCISVGLRKPLPAGTSFPTEYQGVKVFVKIIGEIRPL